MSSTGIGIPIYNDSVLISYLLDSIDMCTNRKHVKIAVIDDGSTEDNQKSVKKICEDHNVDFIYNNNNDGVPKSWNRLVMYLNTDYIILLNNDIIVFDKWFDAMNFFLVNNPNIGTVSLPTIITDKADMPYIIQNMRSDINKRAIEILSPYDKTRRYQTFNLPETRHPVRSMSPIGCSFGFSRKAYDIVYGFNEQYFAFYEEVDFGISLYMQGYPSIILPGPHLYHGWGLTFQMNTAINAQKLLDESREKFISKYGCDQLEVFKRLNHNFETNVTYIDNGVSKTVPITETYSPESRIEW